MASLLWIGGWSQGKYTILCGLSHSAVIDEFEKNVPPDGGGEGQTEADEEDEKKISHEFLIDLIDLISKKWPMS